MPTAASTRPQLGSLPCSAHLSRLLRAIDRATSRASSSVGRVDDLDGDLLGGALGVGDELPGEVGADLRDGRLQVVERPASCPRRRWRAAARCRWWTCSRRSRSGRRSCGSPSRRTASRVAGSATASVVRTTSIVARAGASIPAPLAIPPTVKPGPSATAVLGTESVVQIASAAADPPSVRQVGDRLRRRRQQLVHRQPDADQPGRADRHLGGAAVQRRGRRLGGRVGVLEARRAGAGVGAAGVEDRPP